MKFTHQTFENENVLLDGNEFSHCTFEHCAIEYRGYATTVLEDDVFNNCDWTFAGPAADTIEFLTGLYSAGGNFRALVEKIFDNIRSGRITLPKH